MRNIILLLIVIVFMTTYSKTNKLKKIWQNSTKNTDLTIEIVKQNDSIIEANHCFVAFKGERIDCSVEDTVSIILTKENNNFYLGTFESKYWEDKLIISVQFSKKYLMLKFLDSHPFLQDSIIFHKKY